MTTQSAQTYTWQDKKKGFSTRKDFVMRTPITPWGTCRETRISIFTHEKAEDSAYIDCGSNTPFFCSVEYARDYAKSELEAGYKFI
jgi:hypothetical protein